jgi:molecular chaperone DnaJ
MPDPACNKCAGSGRTSPESKVFSIQVPAGIDVGMKIRVGGQGEPGRPGEPAGDLYVVVQVEAHEFFHRWQQDVIISVPVSYTQLIYGCEIGLPNPHGGEVVLKVPAGTKPEAELRMKKLGIPGLAGHSNGQGDLIAKLSLELPPPDANLEYKKVLDRLTNMEKKYVTTKRREFAAKVEKEKQGVSNASE